MHRAQTPAQRLCCNQPVEDLRPFEVPEVQVVSDATCMEVHACDPGAVSCHTDLQMCKAGASTRSVLDQNMYMCL